MQNNTVEQVIDEIERQSEFYFIFNQKEIDVDRTVNIHKECTLIDEILPDLLIGTNVKYSILNNKILLTLLIYQRKIFQLPFLKTNLTRLRFQGRLLCINR